MEKYKILVINPGSTSTKIAIFENETCLFKTNIFHHSDELLKYPTINAQLPYRLETINNFITENNINMDEIDAIIGRGGGCESVESGVYEIDDLLVSDVIANKGNTAHPSALGIQLTNLLADQYHCKKYTADMICVDEFSDVARMTGIDGVYRKSHIHALNARGVAKLEAKKLNKKYEECNFIVAHIDGGITVSCHNHGKMIDATDGTGGEGSYTPSRTGAVPAIELLEYAKDKDLAEVKKLFSRTGGFTNLLNTNDSDYIHQLVEQGDKKATRVWNGMIYNIIKAIGSFSTVLEGNVDKIILTGGLVRFSDITDEITKKCQFIAPIEIYPDEVEMEALALACYEVLTEQIEVKHYTGKPVWNGFE